jgi:hypothetical protein
MMRICRHPDARAFLARSEPWLQRAEIEHSMPLQTARFACNNEWQYQKPLYWATVEDGAEIVGCAFRTPPYRLGITALPLEAIPALVESVGAIYRSLSGVAGPESSATAFTAAWLRLRGGSSSVRARQQLLEHRAIVPVTRAPPPGVLRPATSGDGSVAELWGVAFARETGLTELDGAACARLIPERRLYLWDDGVPRCMVGVLRETHDAAAIGILYTPLPFRERGYATASVGALSRHLLERGMQRSYFCLDPSDADTYAMCVRLGYGLVQNTVDIDYHSA